jgi:HK97 family phage major capsid protein
MTEIVDIKAQIERMNAANEALADEKMIDRVGDAAARRAPNAAAGDKHRELFTRYLRQGDQGVTAEEWRQIRATMSTTTTTEGGFAVQSDVARTIIDAMKAFGGMREAAEVLVTEMGNPMSFPGSDGTSETGELIAENTTATGADPVFTSVSLNVFKYSSKIVAVPFELLQDAQVDIEAFVRNRLVQRVGRITNAHFTTGTGSGQPRGVVTGAALGKAGTTGQTVTVIFDDLVDLVHSVDPEYRRSPRARFMMNDLSLRTVRKLKDSQGRPIFLPGFDGLAGAMPDSLLGYPVTVNQDVAVMAANAKSILFGDFSKYMIRDALQLQLFRFSDSAYAKLGQVGFLMWARSGGNLLDTTAIKHYANSAS